MATTTASISINSSDLTADVLSLSTSTQFKKAGASTGLDQTTGVARQFHSSAVSDQVLFAGSAYTNDKAHKIYIKNPSVNPAEFISIKAASQEIGRLYAGDFTLIPWQGTYDFKFSTSAINMKVEYLLIHE